jgi:hypothetical protein
MRDRESRTLPLRVVAANSRAPASTEFDSIMTSVVAHASCCGVSLAQSAYATVPHIPTSGTAPGTGGPPLSARGWPTTPSCCAPPAPAHSPAGPRSPSCWRMGVSVAGEQWTLLGVGRRRGVNLYGGHGLGAGGSGECERAGVFAVAGSVHCVW